MSKQWYVKQDGKVFGPMPSATLRDYVTEGRVTARAEVAYSATGPWCPVTDVKGLAFAPVAVAMPADSMPAPRGHATNGEAKRPPKGEQDVWQGRPMLRSRAWGFFVGTLFFWLIIPAIWCLCLAVWIRSKRYELTTERLRITTGVIAKHVEEIELYRVKDTAFRQTITDRLLGIAAVDISSSDTSTPRVEISGISVGDAKHVRESIRALVEELGERKRIREVDYA